MRPRFNKTLGCLIALVASAATIYLAQAFWSSIRELPPDTSKLLIAAATTVLVATVTTIVTRRSDHRARIEQELRLKKAPLYEEFLTFVFRLLMAEKVGQPKLTESEQLNFMLKFTRDITNIDLYM